MRPRYEFGAEVRVIRTVRNDGTFPGVDTGEKLIRAGAVGVVRNVGTFLQDQIIYTVHFLKEDLMVGCREVELIPADAEWTPAKFEFRDRVVTTRPLGLAGEVVVQAGEEGEVVKVLRDNPAGATYHVYFHGRTFLVPEESLSAKEALLSPAVVSP